MGQPRAGNTTSNRRAPGLQQQKAPWFSRVRSPFAGGRTRGDLGRLNGSEGSLQSLANSEPMTMGCSSSFGGGEPLATSSRGVRVRGEGRSFAPDGSAHTAHRHRFNPSSAQPSAGSWRRPQASLRRAVAFGVRTCRRPCGVGKRTSMELMWLAACPLSKGCGLSHAALPERGAREAKANAQGSWLQKGRVLKAGEDRTLEARARVSFT
jgi:hypothetical protein